MSVSHTCVYMCVCVYIFAHTHVHVCMCACVYVLLAPLHGVMHLYIPIYIYIGINI